MIKYLGSKKTLIPKITKVIKALPDVRTVSDVFSGTSRVGHALKKNGYQVFSNDLNQYATIIARCYVQADSAGILESIKPLIQEFNQIKGEPGYFTKTFCEDSRFFQPKNGERVDAIRERIQTLSLEPELEAVAMVSLMEAADRVDSTVGLQMAYLKKWASRAHQDMSLRIPDVLPQALSGKGRAFNGDAQDFVSKVTVDVAYLDPPYNQHKYLGNYHIWESLVRWDKPEVYGIACKRIDVRERKSPFNSKRKAIQAFESLIQSVSARYLVVSFNDEGYISRQDMEHILGSRGEVIVLENDYARHVGAQIGIHSPQGKKVGSVSHLRNIEYLYVVVPKDELNFIYNQIMNSSDNKA